MTKARSNATAEAAKGDLRVGNGTNLSGILAVSTSNGDTIVADSSTSTGLRYQNNFAAGKNKVINGDFGVWQRGTSLSITATFQYLADRWQSVIGFGTPTATMSQQTFTPGTAPVAGYEGQYFLRQQVTVAPGGGNPVSIGQRIEDVRTFANQTVTLSFWAKADSARTWSTRLIQNFGSGGSADVTTSGSSLSVTTGWTRFTQTFTLPSISGKTIGTSSYLYLLIDAPVNTVQIMDIWGVQLEAGSVATAFQTATGTIQGELAACQRYYWQSEASSQYFFSGYTIISVNYYATCKLPTTMRVAPTVTITDRDNSSFPAAAGSVIRITTNSFLEVRAASSNANGAYYGSSVVASAEL